MNSGVRAVRLRALVSGCLLACSACAAITGLDRYGESECVGPCSATTGTQDDADVGDDQPILGDETSIDSTPTNGPTDAPNAPDSTPPSDAATQVDSAFRNADKARESGVPVDAPLDVESGDASSTFCGTVRPRPLFCEDFDDRPLPGLWTTVHQVGGTLIVDNITFVSAPNSLFARNNALRGQALDNVLRALFPLQGTPTIVTLEFHLRPALADPTQDAAVVVAAVDFVNAANDRYSVQFALVSSAGGLRLRLEEQSGLASGGTAYVDHGLLPDALAIGQWTDVLLTITLSGGAAGSAHVVFGATQEIDASLQVAVTPTNLQLDIGSSFESEPSSGWNLLFDNVVFNAN
jgi:hypothetical protein